MAHVSQGQAKQNGINYLSKIWHGQGHVTPKIFRVPPNISGTGKDTNVKFGRPIQRDSLKKCPLLFFSKKGTWPCHVTPKIFRVPPIISGTGKATNVKFGRPIQRDSLKKCP